MVDGGSQGRIRRSTGSKLPVPPAPLDRTVAVDGLSIGREEEVSEGEPPVPATLNSLWRWASVLDRGFTPDRWLSQAQR
jgi:hypothetical protein